MHCYHGKNVNHGQTFYSELISFGSKPFIVEAGELISSGSKPFIVEAGELISLGSKPFIVEAGQLIKYNFQIVLREFLVKAMIPLLM